MNALVIANTQIRRDVSGRYCLNDLHQASGGSPKDQPPRWLRLAQTQELIAELRKADDRYPEMGSGTSLDADPVVAIEGGLSQGTYAIKELVYAYAMWISAKFHLHVIRAYDALVTQPDHDGLPTVPSSAEHRADVLVAASRGFAALVRSGRLMGMQRQHAVLVANTATLRATGIDLADEMGMKGQLAEQCVRALVAPVDQEALNVATFHQALQTNEFGVACTPCLSRDAFYVYQHWCSRHAHVPLTLPRFVHQLTHAQGVRLERKRYQSGRVTLGPAALLLWGYAKPDDMGETAYFGRCVAAFQSSTNAYIKGGSIA